MKSSHPVHLSAALLLSACASPPAELPELRAGPSLDTAGLPAELAASLGFDAPGAAGTEEEPRAGDRLLYRLLLHEDGELQEWLVSMELMPLSAGDLELSPAWQATLTPDDGAAEGAVRQIGVPPSPLRDVAVVVTEWPDGRPIEAVLRLPQSALGTSLYAMGEAFDALSALARADGEPLSPDDAAAREGHYQRAAEGLYALLSLFNGWQRNEVRGELLRRVAGKPSLGLILGAVLSGGVNLNLAVEQEGFEPSPARLPEPLGELPGYRIPMILSANDEALMRVELHAVPGRGPLRTGMGVVGLRGVHPGDGSRWITVELHGARRGS